MAADYDYDTLTYSLTYAPDGMSIDSDTGLITWALPQAGTHAVIVAASDGFYTATQSYSLVINTADDNQPPAITSTYPSSIMAGNTYNYQVEATDEEGDALTYSISEEPVGMTVDENGLIIWETTDEDVGNYEVTITVSDGYSTTDQIIYFEVKEKTEVSENLEIALSWLKEQQQEDGTIDSEYSIATVYQQTDEAYRAAKLIGEPFADSNIRNYLSDADIYMTEHLARRAIYQIENSLDYTNAINTVWSHYIAEASPYDSSIAAYTDLEEGDINIIDTAYALIAQSETSENTAQVNSSIIYLLSQQNNDGSFNMKNNKYQAGIYSDIYVTSIVLRALVAYKNTYDLSSNITLARNYLMQKYSSSVESWILAHSLITLYDALPDKSVLESKVEILKSKQYPNGYWVNYTYLGQADVFATALAIQAIYLFDQ